MKTEDSSSTVARTVRGAGVALLTGVVGVAGSVALATTTAQAAEVTGDTAPSLAARTGVAMQAATAPGLQVRTPRVVEGTFAYTQDRVSSAQEVARAMRGASAILCSGTADATLATTSAAAGVADAADWTISISGSGVASQVSATIGELSHEASVTQVMGCTCLGNPADGRATVNADVTGVDLREVLAGLGLSDDANVITFTSADGYRVSLPLSYVLQRKTLIVYALDGKPLSASVGGTNQLWLGATAARYFASDVVSIQVDAVDEADVPPAPGTRAAGDRYANRPNVGVLAGETDATRG